MGGPVLMLGQGCLRHWVEVGGGGGGGRRWCERWFWATMAVVFDSNGGSRRRQRCFWVGGGDLYQLSRLQVILKHNTKKNVIYIKKHFWYMNTHNNFFGIIWYILKKYPLKELLSSIENTLSLVIHRCLISKW